MRGQQEKKRVFASSNVVFSKRQTCNSCAVRRSLSSSCTSAFMHSFFMCNSLLGRKGYAAALLALMETVLLRFAGLGTDINIMCSVVSSSFRPLVVSLAMSLKRFCGIAYWRGAAIEALATTFRRETESRRRRELKLPKHCGTGFVFALLQPWHRQEQKLIITSLAWHVDLVGPCASRTSLAGGCRLPFDFFVDVFFFLLCIWRRTRAMSFSPWPDGCLADSCTRMAEVSGHASFFSHQVLYLSDHRAWASVWRTSARSSRTCTFMQGQHFS